MSKDALASWVCVQNMDHGVAPSCLDVALEYSNITGQSIDVGDMWLQGDGTRRVIRRWVQRWAFKWGIIKRGKLEHQEDIPHSEVVQKAGLVLISCLFKLSMLHVCLAQGTDFHAHVYCCCVCSVGFR